MGPRRLCHCLGEEGGAGDQLSIWRGRTVKSRNYSAVGRDSDLKSGRYRRQQWALVISKKVNY